LYTKSSVRASMNSSAQVVDDRPPTSAPLCRPGSAPVLGSPDSAAAIEAPPRT